MRFGTTHKDDVVFFRDAAGEGIARMASEVGRKPPEPTAKLARDHLNLAEFPISVASRHQPADQQGRKLDVASFRSNVYDRHARRWIPQTVTVTTNSRCGLPTPADESVILALLYLAKRAVVSY